jgi:hypothetical protein
MGEGDVEPKPRAKPPVEITDEMVRRGANVLLARSGGHFEPIREMSEEKALGDARAVLSHALNPNEETA